MSDLKLYMVLLGCKPQGRFIEQHDVFFGIGRSLKELVPKIIKSWPEAKGNIHIDAWREVTSVNGYSVNISESRSTNLPEKRLFFLNLGGYKKDEFEEFHYKLLTVSENPSLAIKEAKKTAFYKHIGFKGAASHIDDKYLIDVDDIYDVSEILSPLTKTKYTIHLLKNEVIKPDDLFNLGYLQFQKISD
jgi:hypothetical protein